MWRLILYGSRGTQFSTIQFSCKSSMTLPDCMTLPKNLNTTNFNRKTHAPPCHNDFGVYLGPNWELSHQGAFVSYINFEVHSVPTPLQRKGVNHTIYSTLEWRWSGWQYYRSSPRVDTSLFFGDFDNETRDWKSNLIFSAWISCGKDQSFRATPWEIPSSGKLLHFKILTPIKAWFGSLLSIIKKGHCSSWYSMGDFVAWFCCFWSQIFSLQKHDMECYTHVSSSLEAHSTLFSQENLSQKPLLASPRSLLKQFSLRYFYAISQIYLWDWSSSFSFASTT